MAHPDSKRNKAECRIETISQKKGSSSSAITPELKSERGQTEEEGVDRYVQDENEDSRDPGRQESTGEHEIGKKNKEAAGDVLEETEHQFQSQNPRRGVGCDHRTSIHREYTEKEDERKMKQAWRVGEEME